MSKDERGFFSLAWAAICSLPAKIKLIVAAVIAVVGFVAVFVLRKGSNAREILELELKKVRTEIKIEQKQKDIDLNESKIRTLEERESEIREQLKELDSIEPRKNVSNEELDEFFDDRGF
jgi:hypothetical protein